MKMKRDFSFREARGFAGDRMGPTRHSSHDRTKLDMLKRLILRVQKPCKQGNVRVLKFESPRPGGHPRSSGVGCRAWQ